MSDIAVNWVETAHDLLIVLGPRIDASECKTP